MIKAYDYKGKWFVLQDPSNDDMDLERPDVDVAWAMGVGLQEHVGNCVYYGIPAYIGSDKKLNKRIEHIMQGLH